MYEIYFLSELNSVRYHRMLNRFKLADLNYNHINVIKDYDEEFNKIRLYPIYKDHIKVISIMLGHLKMLKKFYYETNNEIQYGIFLEDDVHIFKNFKYVIPEILKTFTKLNLDVLLIGYLLGSDVFNPRIPIHKKSIYQLNIDFYLNKNVSTIYDYKKYFCVDLNSNEILNEPNLKNLNDILNFNFYKYENILWGAQGYILSKSQAKKLIDKYTDEYYIETLSDPNLTYFSPDWTLTKEGTRALMNPMLIVEEYNPVDGNVHDEYHFTCNKINFRSELYF